MPDPAEAGTAAEFMEALRRLKNWCGVGFRRLEKRAAAAGEPLPRSTLTAALCRDTLPREELVAAFVRACGLDEGEVNRWLAARRRIAAGSPTRPGGDPPPEPARCTLPADLAVFVGRDKEREQVDTAVAEAATQGGVIAIHAIDGMPGIGKTALAVHVGHRLRDRFGDGQLFFDLHAHTPGRQPVRPAEALAEALAADGMETTALPTGVDGLAALWRDRTAGRRLLLILDNAASSEQVLPLLPSSPGSLVLVISRRTLGDLPAVSIALDVLAPDEAAAMFVRMAPRAAAEPGPVADLVEACGYLPLAISIAASLYLRHRSWGIADLLKEIGRSADGLLTMTAEHRTVAAVFDLSYQDLTPERRRFFRLLGLHPGADLDAYAAAALTGVSWQEAAGHLDGLHAGHLLAEPNYRRYRMHDLIRAFARTAAVAADPAPARQQAVTRLLDSYLDTAVRADGYLAFYTRPAAVTGAATAAGPELTSVDQAVAWLRTERANLLACVHYAATAGGQPGYAVGLTASLAGLLRTDGPWALGIALHEAAAQAADRLGDRLGQATALHDQGHLRRLAGEYPAATDLQERALALYQATGHRLGQANALAELGSVRGLAGEYQAAADLLGRALGLYQAVGDRRGQATACYGLGVARWFTGDYLAAADLLGRARDLYQAVGDRRGQANAFYGLGVVHGLLGDYQAAAELFGRGLALYQALGARLGQANALQGLAGVRRVLGEYPAAADLFGRALEVHRALGSRVGQANALHGLGVVRRLTGDHAAAAALLERARELQRELGDRHGQAVADSQLAMVRHLTGDHRGAADLLEETLVVFREVGVPDDEAEALNQLAVVHRHTGRPARALTLHRQALEIARRIRHRLEEARALHGIGGAARDRGDDATAAAHLRLALDIYRRLGVPEAGQVAAELAGLAASGALSTEKP